MHCIHLAMAGVLLMALQIAGCGSEGPDGDFCWMSVDTLYISGLTISDTSDVHAAFNAYVAYVDTTSAEFPEDSDWEYATSRRFACWRGRLYWQVEHWVFGGDVKERVRRYLAYVDQNGVVVRPYGCI